MQKLRRQFFFFSKVLPAIIIIFFFLMGLKKIGENREKITKKNFSLGSFRYLVTSDIFKRVKQIVLDERTSVFVFVFKRF